MTRVDFYILPAEATPPVGAVITACKLCDKVSSSGGRVFVFSPDAAVADSLDAALWSFRQNSFIGHERLGGVLEEPLPPVLIGNGEPPATYHSVMINLGLEVPPFFSRFERVLEIVESDAVSRAKSRERYKFYRDRGYELASHDL